jgi:uncharacterized protein DUF397
VRPLSRETTEWRKSSFSQDGGECVELAWHSGQAFARDSKNPTGLVIPVDLTGLTEAVKADRFDR